MSIIDIGTTDHPFISNFTTDSEAYKCMLQSLMGKECRYTKGEYEGFRDRLQVLFDKMNELPQDKNRARKMLMVSIYIKLLDAQLCIYDEYCNLQANAMDIIELFLPQMEKDLQDNNVPN